MARLTVISEALAWQGRRVILKVTRGQPISGSGRLTFECGNCGAVVLQDVRLDQIRDCVIECDCGAFNEPPPADSSTAGKGNPDWHLNLGFVS